MQQRTALGALALLALAALGGYLLAQVRGTSTAISLPATDGQAPAQRSTEANACMALAKRHGQQIELLQAELASLRGQAGMPPAAQQEEDEEQEASDEIKPALVDPFVAHVEQLEARFAEEPRDARWNAEPSVRSKASAMLPPGSKLRDLACQSSLCRLETSHPDLETYKRFLEQGFGKLDDPANVWPGNTTFSMEDHGAEHGGIVAVAYLQRAP